MANVGRLSSSKVTTYEGCSFSYWLQYVLHAKFAKHVRLVFGSTTHYMADKFYKVKFKSSESFVKHWRFYWFSTIAGDFLKGKERDNLKVVEYPTKTDFVLKVGSHVNLGPEPLGTFFGYMRTGDSILEAFYDRHINKPSPLERELTFGRKKSDIIKIGDHEVTGVFDRIDNFKEKWYITDYKTDKHSPEKDSFTLHRNPQFTLYSYVFRKLFDKKEEAILFYHLKSGKIFKTFRSEKDYDYLKRLLDKVSEGITKDKFVPFYGFHCNFCDKKSVCEQYSIPYHGGPKIDIYNKIKGAKEFKLWYDVDTEVPSWMEGISEN